MIFVTKRNGKKKPYDKRFIQIAIGKAEKELYGKESDLSITVADEVTNYIVTHNIKVISVKQIEDKLLEILKKKNKTDVAKAYEKYRDKRESQRKHLIDKQILDLIDGSNEFLAKENANKNSTLVSTQRDLMAGTISRNLSLRFKIPQFLVEAHNEGLIKLHDLDYFLNPETNCVEENGWICFKDEDGVRNIQLKDLQKILNITANGTFKINKKCYVLGRNGWTRLLAISVRDTKENEPIYEFSTHNGINLKTTGEHRIPVIRNNEEVLLEAKDIQKGDELLSSNGLTINPYEYSNNESYINLLDLDDENLSLSVVNISPLRHYIRYKYNTTLQSILGLPKIPKRLTVPQLKKILEVVDIPYDIFYKLKLCAKGSKTKLSIVIPVNESLAKLYGYIYADGGVYVNKKQSYYNLTFTNTDLNLIDDFRNCFEKVFGFKPSKVKPSGTSPCWRSTVGSKIIVKFFKDFCEGKFNGSGDISLPKFIINGNRSIKLAFLSSAIDCDGCLGSEQITYTTCSEKYSGQITNMINSLGYKASMSSLNEQGKPYTFKHYNGHRNYDSYKIRLSRKEDIYNFNKELNCYKSNLNYQEYKNFKSKEFVNRKIKDIKIRTYNTKVYDLQTDTGWFIVNDYVVHNCCLIPLDDLFSNGTVINNVKITTPKSLMTAMTLATQIITQVTSHQYGGCTISLSHIAPYVRISKNKYINMVRQEGLDNNINYTEQQIESIANSRLKKEIKDGVQTFNYQINTMNSSNGRLAVYSGNIINY